MSSSPPCQSMVLPTYVVCRLFCAFCATIITDRPLATRQQPGQLNMTPACHRTQTNWIIAELWWCQHLLAVISCIYPHGTAEGDWRDGECDGVDNHDRRQKWDGMACFSKMGPCVPSPQLRAKPPSLSARAQYLPPPTPPRPRSRPSTHNVKLSFYHKEGEEEILTRTRT